MLVARDEASGEMSWTLAVYANPVDPLREADVQWVFFAAMTLAPDGRLRIVNERREAFLVDLQRRSVSPVAGPA